LTHISDWCARGSFVCQWGWCDAYALNVIPGEGAPAGRVLRIGRDRACLESGVRRILQDLGLKSYPRRASLSHCRARLGGSGHLVAAACATKMVGDVESFGFHLYRLDRSGPWSHKHGTEEAQDVDEAGLTIGDPLAASRGDYEDFLGYWVGRPRQARQRCARLARRSPPGQLTRTFSLPRISAWSTVYHRQHESGRLRTRSPGWEQLWELILSAPIVAEREMPYAGVSVWLPDHGGHDQARTGVVENTPCAMQS